MRNGQGFEIAEDVSYAGVHMQNWVLACFGYQYLFHGHLTVVSEVTFKMWKVFTETLYIFDSSRALLHWAKFHGPQAHTGKAHNSKALDRTPRRKESEPQA